MNIKSIGEHIRIYRQKASLTQQELGRLVGVSWEMISRYERGISSPLGRIDALSKALNVDPLELLQKPYKTNFLKEGGASRIPIFSTVPVGYDFLAAPKHYYYSAPDWVTRIDPDVFLIEASAVKIDTIQLKSSGPIYISPSSEPGTEDTVLFFSNNQAVIDILTRVPENTKIVGVVLAQELRFK